MLTDAEWSATRLSFQVATVAMLVDLAPAVLIGYWLSRTRAAARIVVEILVDLPLVMPPVVTGYVLLALLGRNGPIGAFLERFLNVRITFTWIGAAVASAVVGFPLVVRAARLAFQGVDPRLELAARGLGASPLAAFWRVALPLAGRGVLVGAIMCFARALGEFGATIMVAGNIEGRTQTIPLAIYSIVNRPGGFDTSWRLVALSAALAAGAIVAAAYLERRASYR